MSPSFVAPKAPYAVVTVDHRVGKATEYGVAITTNGIDRVPTGLGPYGTPREAQREADRLQRELEENNT